MKLCIDCQFFIVGTEVCAQSKRTPDFVRGTDRGAYRAQLQRESLSPDDCGPDARHFKTIPIAAVA